MEAVFVAVAIITVVLMLTAFAFSFRSGRNFVKYPKWTDGMIQPMEDYGSRIKQMSERYRFKAVSQVALGMVQQRDDGQYLEAWARQQDVPRDEIVRVGRGEARRAKNLFEWYAEQQELPESPDQLSEDDAIRYAFFRHAMASLFEVVDGR